MKNSYTENQKSETFVENKYNFFKIFVLIFRDNEYDIWPRQDPEWRDILINRKEFDKFTKKLLNKVIYRNTTRNN